MTEKETSSVFDSLPGMEVPVGLVSHTLEGIWSEGADTAGSKPSDFRASQMNLVLHLGMKTTADSAKKQFEIALDLSRKHPARTVVLCPLNKDEMGGSMRAKVFSECHVGRSLKEMVCCEVVLLSYPFETRRFLESHVSVCLEADLPIYYWPHCIASGARLEDYSYLLQGARRILFDSGCENAGVAQALTPFAGKLRDLADTRLLRVKQSIGRFMSGFQPDSLVDGLRSVVVRHGPAHEAEAACLLRWTGAALRRCASKERLDAQFVLSPNETSSPGELSLEFSYQDESRTLCWVADFEKGHEQMKGDLGAGLVTARGPTSFLPPEVVLAEAIFS